MNNFSHAYIAFDSWKYLKNFFYLRTLTQNIRARRGEKVDIRIPIFKDVNTPEDLEEIHMDAMAFGMGCCCLQVR